MVIIIAELLLKTEEIQNEMPLLLEWISPSSRILIDILEFHAKVRSHFDMLSSVYLILQSFSFPELQMNYLRRPYDIQGKISSHI